MKRPEALVTGFVLFAQLAAGQSGHRENDHAAHQPAKRFVANGND